MEAAESTGNLQIHFRYYASGPLVQRDYSTKENLEITISFDVVFSSDRSCDRFTGKPVSVTTGLYYEYSRWYDPTIGRFISQDPLAGHKSNPQSLNRYTYVLDTPTSLTDPSGADPWYLDLLESLGPENDVINIAQHVTGVNIDQLVANVGGSQAEQVFTASRVLSGATFLASGIVAGAAIIAPVLGFGGSTAIGVCEEDPQACDPTTPPPADNEIDQFAKTVPPGTRAPYTTQFGNIVRRFFGGDSIQLGHYWTTASNLLSRGAAITSLDLPQGPPPEPVNTAEFLAEGYLPPGSHILVGLLQSGATEIIVDDPLSQILNQIVKGIPS